MIVVVMQPTYLPWLGYFDLIDQSDLFVFLDSVQFEKQSWQQRNRIKTSQGPLWLTVPVYQNLSQNISDVCINNKERWKNKHWMSLKMNYIRSRFWTEYSAILKKVYTQDWNLLLDLNIHLIEVICQIIGIRYNFIRTSQIKEISGKKSDLLISTCKALNADVYLSPQGSRAYLQSDKKFKDHGISLKFHQYKHPIYPQLYGEFIPYLSLIDLVMNTGNDALDFIVSGRYTPRA
jgi:hypothetical protein